MYGCAYVDRSAGQLCLCRDQLFLRLQVGWGWFHAISWVQTCSMNSILPESVLLALFFSLQVAGIRDQAIPPEKVLRLGDYSIGYNKLYDHA